MIRIFVEGKEDQIFIEKYLDHILNDLDRSKYEVKTTNGYTNLKMVSNQFTENTDARGTNLIIFDADYESNNGGLTNRKRYIENKLEELSISAKVFLLPNNSDDGDLETLLENIINPKHRRLLDCFEGYEKCVGGYLDENNAPIYLTPNRKAKIYAYIESFKKNNSEQQELKKGCYLFNNKEYWNLDSEYLDPLRDFLCNENK